MTKSRRTSPIGPPTMKDIAKELLTPEAHAELSEALAKFGVTITRRIVRYSDHGLSLKIECVDKTRGRHTTDEEVKGGYALPGTLITIGLLARQAMVLSASRQRGRDYYQITYTDDDPKVYIVPVNLCNAVTKEA